MSALQKKRTADMLRFAAGDTSVPPPPAKTPNSQVVPMATPANDEHDEDIEGPPSDKEVNAVVGAVKKDTATESKEAIAAALSTVTSELKIFMDQHSALRAEVNRSSGRVDAPYADSEDATDYIRVKLHKATGRTPAQSAVDTVLNNARARARSEQIRKRVHLRLANDGDDIVIDTANTNGEVIRVTSAGYGVEPQGDLLFHRGAGTGELPKPTHMDVHRAYGVLADFAISRGVKPPDVPVYVMVLVEHARPGAPHPILEYVGGAGSGKSTTARDSISIIDPTPDGDIPTTGINEPDLMACAANRFTIQIDNVSHLDGDKSDLLCRVSTGTVLESRKFYTQRENESVHVQRPVVITAITPVGHKSDYRTRTMTFQLSPPVHGYKSEADVRKEFAAQHADLLGAICALLSVGLANLAMVKGQRRYTHRLADFEQLGEAVHQARGQPPGWFGDQLSARRKVDAASTAEADPLLVGVVKTLEAWLSDAKLRVAGKPSGRGLVSKGVCVWSDATGEYLFGTTTKWLESIRHLMPFDQKEQPPANERALRNALEHRKPTLDALGWKLDVRQVSDRWAVTMCREVSQ